MKAETEHNTNTPLKINNQHDIAKTKADKWFVDLCERYNFQTGDLLLFQHTYDWGNLKDLLFNTMDSIITFFTKSKYTHSGIIIKDPQWRTDLKGYFFLESNWEFYADSEDHEVKIGVELVPLKRIFEDNRRNRLYFRKLECARDDAFNEKLIKAQSVAHNRPYDMDLIDWIKAAFNIHIGNEQNKRRFWCSALCAFIYVQLGVLPATLDWSIVSPKQLGTEVLSQSLAFQNCIMKPEVLLGY